MSWLDGVDEPNVLNDVFQKRNTKVNPADATVATYLGNFYKQHPYTPAGVALSLAENQEDPAVAEQIALRAARTAPVIYDKQAQQRTSAENSPEASQFALAKKVWGGARWLFGHTLGKIGPLKTATQTVTSTLDSSAQMVQNIASVANDDSELRKYLRGGPLAPSGEQLVTDLGASTSLGAMLNQQDTGTGFFLGGQAEESRAKAARRWRGEVNGHTWTVGRGAANMVFIPGSMPYNALSGALDAAVVWKADPLNAIQKASHALKAGEEATTALRRAIPAIETADELAVARKLAEHGSGILTTAEEATIDKSKFFSWLDSSEDGVKLVEKSAAETDELKIMEGYGWKITPEQARRIATETDPDKVRGIIAEQAVRLSDETTTGMVPFPATGKQLPFVVERTPARRLLQNSRWLAGTPKEVMLVNGTPVERTNALKNITNWLRTMKVDPFEGEGRALVQKAFDAYGADGTKVDVDQLFRMFMGDADTGERGLVATVLEKNGIDKDVVDTIVQEYQRNVNAMRVYSLNASGDVADGGFVKHLLGFMTPTEVYDLKSYFAKTRILPGMTPAEIDDVINNLDDSEIVLHGPAALIDLLNNVQILPDPRAIRRLTTTWSPLNNPFWNLTKDGHQLGAIAGLEFLQNEIWRPYALTTFGFIMRNAFDAQLRMAATGISSQSPLDFILMAIHKSGLGTINDGASWVRKAGEAVYDMDSLTEYEQFVKGSTHLWVGDPESHLNRLVKNGDMAIVNTGQATYPRGLTESLRRIHTDPILRMVARLSHLPEPRQIEVMTQFLDSGTEEAKTIMRTLERYAKDGYKVANPNNGRKYTILKFPNWETLTTEEKVTAWYEHLGKSQVENVILNQNEEMRVIAGYNHVPTGPSEMWDESMVRSLSPTGARPKIGDILTEDITLDVTKPKFRNYLVMEAEATPSPTTGKIVRQWKVVPVTDVNQALIGEDGSYELKKVLNTLIERHADNLAAGEPGVVPSKVRMASVVKPDNNLSPVEKLGRAALNGYQAPSRWFFSQLVPKATEIMERSPAFRTNYYRMVAENARLLESSEASTLLDNIDDYARRMLPDLYAKNPTAAKQRWIGGKENWRALNEAVSVAKASNGMGTIEQLHIYSATRALNDTADLLFDASNRNNLEDAMRIVSPFGAAWREVLATWGKLLLEDPTRVRKAQLLYRGFTQTDPDQDGRGFIWNDPQSNAPMFTFPLSGKTIELFTTLGSAFGFGKPLKGVSLNAPVQRLSAGLTVIPSVGPVGQVAASWLFNHADTPWEDTFRKVLTPYGDSKVAGFVPGWMTKAYSGLFDDSTKLDTMYGNTWSDVAAYLATTGNYDLSNSDSAAQLMEDAKESGRILTVIRAVSQFVGPTSGKPEYRVTTAAGDAYAGELIKAFGELQTENYDTAVARFLETFGEDAMVYMGAKTKVNPEYGGLEATAEFGKWEAKNKDLIDVYKKTAPYLAPAGDTFAFEVWMRQVGEMKRFRQTPADRIAQAQKRVGSSIWVEERSKFPVNPTKQQAAELRNIRADIHKRYPGFPIVADFNPNEFKNFVQQLRELVTDKRTKGNKNAASITRYLDIRDAAIKKLKDAGTSIDSTKNPYAIQMKAWLYSKGREIVNDNPEFGRIWDRELSAEVESIGGE